ncbi:hypothetical protein [Micromonospora sp. 4G55]|uniref:hypothetical protein n=1 Tax=Micromonospora sp. 4G55 TaxID=2806102 RepID=UPI001A40F650|nr:hypothetical protein [Micromonospora sp. 4G55]MBM0256540.1 hypothetical protein [Micromonospora sp. 4G55]
MTTTRPGPRARLTGGLLLWYGVLGGAVAWAVHVLVAWGLDELACAAGSERVSAVPLGPPSGWRWSSRPWPPPARWRSPRWCGGAPPARSQRAPRTGLARSRMLAVVGIWLNLLFLTIIVLGGVAVLVLPPCQS